MPLAIPMEWALRASFFTFIWTIICFILASENGRFPTGQKFESFSRRTIVGCLAEAPRTCRRTIPCSVRMREVFYCSFFPINSVILLS